MKIRCELHLGGEVSKLILVTKPEEKAEHLALKLAAFAMFMPFHPTVEPSSKHPALAGMDIKPDLFCLNLAGEVQTWIECGEVSINKLDKVTRRWPSARVVVLKETPAQAGRLRESLTEQVRNGQRVEVWSWPNAEFRVWLNAMAEKTEIFGDAHEKSLNLVVNDVPIALDLIAV